LVLILIQAGIIPDGTAACCFMEEAYHNMIEMKVFSLPENVLMHGFGGKCACRRGRPNPASHGLKGAVE
jgi:hypothetical protein